jgi:hypothetical protein
MVPAPLEDCRLVEIDSYSPTNPGHRDEDLQPPYLACHKTDDGGEFSKAKEKCKHNVRKNICFPKGRLRGRVAVKNANFIGSER